MREHCVQHGGHCQAGNEGPDVRKGTCFSPYQTMVYMENIWHHCPPPPRHTSCIPYALWPPKAHFLLRHASTGCYLALSGESRVLSTRVVGGEVTESSQQVIKDPTEEERAKKKSTLRWPSLLSASCPELWTWSSKKQRQHKVPWSSEDGLWDRIEWPGERERASRGAV